MYIFIILLVCTTVRVCVCTVSMHGAFSWWDAWRGLSGELSRTPGRARRDLHSSF